MKILAMYDISCDKKRTKVEKLLSSYGYRVNYSVFEIECSTSQYRQILQRLLELTAKEDNVRIYPLTADVLKRSFRLHHDKGPFDAQELYF